MPRINFFFKKKKYLYFFLQNKKFTRYTLTCYLQVFFFFFKQKNSLIVVRTIDRLSIYLFNCLISKKPPKILRQHCDNIATTL
jgi:hypothetical protein